MFEGFAPPQASPEEIRAAEAQANGSIKQALTTAAFLYICSSFLTILSLLSPKTDTLFTYQLLSSSRPSGRFGKKKMGI
ncbi:hypothetical protein QBC38DRAFT_474152 [Podospora fimiseda]|uniref:Uncharacterized protein n=1 Tax=Podospora fimiseda TaxID=252190 RepID=A0AAN7GX54_9PEZI|nr:hypothetical protein QBC38DRAFT_474152 [Podospora fimiseda]